MAVPRRRHSPVSPAPAISVTDNNDDDGCGI